MNLFAKLSSYDERSARLAGIGLMLLSIFMFSFGDAMGKFIVATYSVGQLLLMLITRSLRATPDIVLASSQFSGTLLLGALLAPFGWVTPSVGSLALFAAAGCTSAVALLCVNRSLKLAAASVVVPYQYSMIVWAVIFGYVVFGDVPSWATIVGAAIIIGAGFYIFLRERELGCEEAG